MPSDNAVPLQLSSPQAVTGALAVNLQEAAEMLGVHVNTIRREVNRGNLAAVRIGRVLRIRVAELHAYLKRNEKRVNPME